jgi:hypothetical protein
MFKDDVGVKAKAKGTLREEISKASSRRWPGERKSAKYMSQLGLKIIN